MEQTIHTPETYDFRKYDQIWRRVAPNLEPYPDLREPAVPAMAPLASGAAPRASQPPAGEDLEHLPGAEENPCCMGTMAQEELGVIEGFIEVELADRRTYQAFAGGHRLSPGDDAGIWQTRRAQLPAADDGLLPHHWELLPPGGGQRTDFHR